MCYNYNMNLEKLEQEKKEINDFLSRPDAYSDPNFAAKSRRLSEIDTMIDLYKKIEQFSTGLTEAKALIDDPELGEMAKEDIEDLTKKIAEAQAELDEMLIPRDPNDDKPAIL